MKTETRDPIPGDVWADAGGERRVHSILNGVVVWWDPDGGGMTGLTMWRQMVAGGLLRLVIAGPGLEA